MRGPPRLTRSKIAASVAVEETALGGPQVPVLHVIAPAPFGGAESVVRALAAASRSAGRPFRVATLLQDPGAAAWVAELREEGAAVTEVACGRRRYLAEARAVARAAREQGIAVVHTHIYHADFVGWRAARIAGVPVVATVHGHTGGSPGNRLYEWLDRRLLRRFEAVVCVSESVRAALLRSGCAAGRLTVITNGFVGAAPLARDEARRALGVEGEAPLVGWVGRFSVEKGADLFVDAFAQAGLPGAQAVLIGDGPERPGVEALAARSRAAAGFRFAGARPRAARLLSALDVLVLSSRTEGTPMILLEAMAAGVPIVAFAVGGVGRVVDASSARVVPPGDTGALAAALREVLARPDEARARAGAARRVVEERFGAARWLSELDAVWERVAGADRTRPAVASVRSA